MIAIEAAAPAKGRRLPSQMARGSMALAMCYLAAMMLLTNTLVREDFTTLGARRKTGPNAAALDQCCCSFERPWTTAAAISKAPSITTLALRKGRLSGRPLLQLMPKKWTPDEDKKLRDAVAQAGGAPESVWVQRAWESIAECVGRESKPCAERWHNHLAPGLETGKPTVVEDAAMIIVYARFGPMWVALARVLRRGPKPFADRWSTIKNAAATLDLTLAPREAVSADAVARVLRDLQHGGASYDADVVADALESVGRAFTPEIAVPNARFMAELVGNELAALPPAAAAPKKPKKPAPVGVPRPRPRGRAPRDGSGEPATWDAAAGRWLHAMETEQAPPRLAAQVAVATSQALALAVPYIVEALPTSKLAVTCSSIKQLVNWSREAAMRQYRMRDYPSRHAPMRLGRAGISGLNLHAPSTCLGAGGTGLIVASAGSRVSGVGAARVLRVDEMEVDVQRAFFDVQHEVDGLFGDAERFQVVPRELFGAEAQLHAGRSRLGWQNGGTDRGPHKSRHAELIDVERAADGHRHGCRACSEEMLDGLAFLADGLEAKRRLYPESRRWKSTVHVHNRTILTPPGSERRAVTHSAHRDCDHCPHTGITRMPLVVLVFVRYYTLDAGGMLRRASPDLARVSGLRFRELPRGAGPDIFAQIADDGFVMFDAHANAHFTHEVMRAADPAEGIYRISIVVHLMSLPEQREGEA